MNKQEPEIVSYFHCKECVQELPNGVSPQEYSDLDVGFTPYGLEVWCNRHDVRVVYYNLTDVWTTLNTLRRMGMNQSPMPIIPVREDEVPQNLIRTGVVGVFIDPDAYWGEGGKRCLLSGSEVH